MEVKSGCKRLVLSRIFSKHEQYISFQNKKTIDNNNVKFINRWDFSFITCDTQYSKQSYAEQLTTLLTVFAIVGLRKVYPHSGWMSVWSFVCIFLTSYTLVHLNTNRLNENIKTSCVKLVQNKDVYFSTEKHGKYANLLNFVAEMRKESNQRYGNFEENLLSLGWESLGWDYTRMPEYWSNTDKISEDLEALWDIVELIQNFEHEFDTYLEESTIKMKSVMYQTLEKHEADKLWPKNFKTLEERREEVRRLMKILVDVAFLNMDAIFLIEDCEGFKIEEESIYFSNESDLTKYEEIICQLEGCEIEFNKIDEAVSSREAALIEKFAK